MHHDIHCYQLGFHCLQMEDSLSIAVCKYLSKKKVISVNRNVSIIYYNYYCSASRCGKWFCQSSSEVAA